MDRAVVADAPGSRHPIPLRRTLAPPRSGARTARTSDAVPDFELIVGQPRQSFRWNVHGHPHPLAKWHYHPEYELHLIQHTSGKMFVGDYIGNFHPGTLVLSGPNLPHNWVSDIAPGEEIPDRDMLIQFSDEMVRDVMRLCPELEEIAPLFDDARHGVEFHGEAAEVGAHLLRQIGRATPTRRMILFLELLDALNRSPERSILSSLQYAPTLDHGVSDTINNAIDFLITNLADPISLSEAARFCGMSDSVFSRFFKKNTGHGFVGYVNRMRINRACILLKQNEMSITDICFATGFNNLSNFNRQFRRITALTPSEYRRQAKRNMKRPAERGQIDPAPPRYENGRGTIAFPS